ncbi:hypothetical protein BDBG_06405 [Blastomyces gilchristii SLH14081]|uniref:RING-type domain-containing protein n=1 Tax=Blastomyces gilchristii (strain SLH14081) TaxID=559298 RepID=A0A179URE5_BLAGS|nr:uncharacterized protein BDBG_06405 [Blastomyces gilchristii SLH14081]OAT10584.1 hypothetical protein BDBG_06405 [Blastomyces gilchristii SLH14081]
MHEVRCENDCLFSVTHLESFYQQVIQHTAQTVNCLFDFVTAARLGNEVGEDYINHIQNLLNLGHGFNIPHSDLTLFITSSILMDAYSPKMHYFPPNLVYHTLYKSFCLGAMRRSVFDAGSTLLLIEIHMEWLFSHLLSEYSSSAHLHCDNLSKQSCSWIQVRFNQTCLYCLQRRPEKTLSCGHTICDMCIRVFRDAVPHVEEKFTMQQCILYGLQITFTAVLQLLTASMSILSINSGGSRGVISLKFLRLMQEMIDCPIQNLFDMAVSTSSAYKLLRSDVAVNEPSLWKMLFPPVQVGSCKFENGRLGRYNNPVYLTLAESRRILPSGTSPDLILSLGTGVKKKPKDQVPVPSQSVIHNSFIYWLSQSMLQSMNGEATWRELLAHIDITSKTDFIRFNTSINWPLKITNVEEMKRLRNTVHIQPDSAAQSESDMFQCQGSIRCQGDGRTVALNLVQLGMSIMEIVKDTEVLGQLSITDLNRDICSACGCYCKNILFYWFEDTQGFNACFSSADHGTLSCLNCQACGPGTSNSRAQK